MMATQTSTTNTNTTETLTSKMRDAGGVFWVADKENKSSNHSYKEETSGFLLNLFGLALPPLPILAAPMALAYYREIPFWDLFFVIAFSTYLGLANRFRFDNNSKLYQVRKRKGLEYPEKPEWFEQSNETWFMRYMLFAATLGVLVPLGMQFVAPPPVAQAAAPHLFVLVCQIVMEHSVNNPRFHPLLQVMTPIAFSAYRMATLKSWVKVAFDIHDHNTAGITWEKAGFLLAVANLIFWTYNLFIMLALRVLPPCMQQTKFLDANVAWDKYCQLVPTVNGQDSTTKKQN